MAMVALIAALLLSVALVVVIRCHGNRDKIVCHKADQMVRDNIDHH